MKEVISRENITDIAAKMLKDESVTNDDMDNFSNGIAKFSMLNGDTLIGKTVGEVIDMQKESIKESSKNSLLLASTKSELVLSHKFKLIQFGKKDSADQKTNIISFKITNLTDKNILNLQGYLNILNQQNQILKKFPINIKKPIEAGQSYDLYTPPYVHDDSNENDRALRIEGNVLRPAWQAVLVEFEGGRKLGPVQ
jgi:hypothetical protein